MAMSSSPASSFAVAAAPVDCLGPQPQEQQERNERESVARHALEAARVDELIRDHMPAVEAHAAYEGTSVTNILTELAGGDLPVSVNVALALARQQRPPEGNVFGPPAVAAGDRDIPEGYQAYVKKGPGGGGWLAACGRVPEDRKEGPSGREPAATRR